MMTPYPNEKTPSPFHPVAVARRLLFALAGGIFLSEIFIMRLIAAFFPGITVEKAAFLDSVLLTAVVFPLLYFMVFRPLASQISRREEAEGRLVEANRDLESRVAERTVDLNRALSEAESSREKIRCILDSITEALLVVDSSNAVILINPKAEELLGICGEKDLYRPLESVLRDPALLQSVETAKTGEGVEVPSLGHPRKELFLRVKAAPLKDRSDARGGWLLVLEDIARLRELDRLKSELVSTAAHELSTPLATIMGYAELLLTMEGDLDPAQRKESLLFISEKAEALSRIVDNLLDLGRIEAGRAPRLNKEQIDIQELIRRTAQPIFAHSSRHRLELDLPGESVRLLADRGEIAQVLDNILNNACKYSPGGGAVRISGVRIGEEFRVSVQDEGIGMSAEARERIFEKFFRADVSDTAPRGTGIGMSIARHIVMAHGGTIWVESEWGRGTIVHFTLPLPPA